MSETHIPIALFRVGQICTTPNAMEALSQDDILTAIGRHQAGDWGDLNEQDRWANDRAMINRSRLFSVYYSAKQVKFWVVTESDRRRTTVLLPEDH